MAIDRKPLAFGQLPVTKGAVYTAPSDKQGSVRSMHWFNNHTAAVTCKWYLDTGTEYQEDEFVLQSKEKRHDPYPGIGFLVPADGVIRAEASVATVVTHKFDGAEE